VVGFIIGRVGRGMVPDLPLKLSFGVSDPPLELSSECIYLEVEPLLRRAGLPFKPKVRSLQG
jgi:hypothetical protein